MARGVYGRPNDPPALHPSLLLLQRRFEGMHVGGKSALDWYGVRQPLQEGRELVESAYSLRADVLRELLQHGTSVKTARLCLQHGREGSLPWVDKLDPGTLLTGRKRPWVSRSADGLLVLKP